jgi:hypothetical protein
MLKKASEFFRKFLDPTGPIGEVVSPSDVFKSHAGLPYQVGLRQRAELAPLSFEQVQRACAPERYYAKGEIEVPLSRERVVSPYILERYSPVMAGMEIVGYRVIQEPRSQFCDCLSARWSREGGTMVHVQCGRRRAPISDEQIIEKALSIQMQPSDAFYDQYYVTIPGNDKGVVDGMEVKGGTRISSRREYNERTKGWVHWDKGTPAAVDKAVKEEKEQRKANVARVVEERAHRLVSDRPGDL